MTDRARLAVRGMSRRRFVQSAVIGGAGLASAALLGCRADTPSPGTAVPGAPSSGTAVPGASDSLWATAKRGGTLTIAGAIPADPSTFDPYRAVDTTTLTPAGHVYSRLLKSGSGPGIDPFAKIVPDVVKSFEATDAQGLEWNFTLRPDVRFHDIPPLNGRPLTSEDVRSSFERFIATSANAGQLKSVVKRLDVIDDRTFRFTLNEPYASFPDALRAPNGMWLLSVEANTGKIDPRVKAGVIGTGPWIFDSYRPAVDIQYRANPKYFESVPLATGPAVVPLLDRLHHGITGEYATRLSQFASGNSDIFVPQPRDVATVRGRAALRITKPAGITWGFYFNLAYHNGLFNDPRMRIAVSKSINRDALIETFGETSRLKAEGIPFETGWHNAIVPWGAAFSNWWLDPKSAAQGPTAANYAYDPADARRLMQAAGYTGDSIPLYVTTYGSAYDQFIEAQLGMLSAAGLAATVKQLPLADHNIREQNGSFDGFAFDATVGSEIDQQLAIYLDPTSTRLSTAYRPATPAMADKFRLQRRTLDSKARREIVYDLQRMASDVMITAPSTYSSWSGVELGQSRVKNFVEFRGNSYGIGTEERPYFWLAS